MGQGFHRLRLRAVICGLTAITALLAGSSSSRATVQVQYVDRGTPIGFKPGPLYGSDWRAGIVRIVSDEPILAVDAASSFGTRLDQNYGIFGATQHYWFSPPGQVGNFQPSALASEDNSAASALNFDGHFLPLPAGATYTVAPSEVNLREFGYFDFDRYGFPDDATPYQRAMQGNFLSGLVDGVGRLSAAAVFDPAANVRQFDLAYLFLNPGSKSDPRGENASAAIPYRFAITTVNGTSMLSGYVQVPESGVLATAVFGAMTYANRRIRRPSRSLRAACEPFDSRFALAVSAPQNVHATMVAAINDAERNVTPTLISWDGVTGASGYRVESSPDHSNWTPSVDLRT